MAQICDVVCVRLIKTHLPRLMSLIGDFDFSTICSTSPTLNPFPTSQNSSTTILIETRFLGGQSGSLADTIHDTDRVDVQSLRFESKVSDVVNLACITLDNGHGYRASRASDRAELQGVRFMSRGPRRDVSPWTSSMHSAKSLCISLVPFQCSTIR